MKLIPLTKGAWAIVDSADYDLVSQYKWCLQDHKDAKRRYAITCRTINGKKKTIRMHRLILPHSQVETDHISGDGLDNRRDNLRPASRKQNQANVPVRPHSSKFKGVHHRKKENRWTAKIRVDGELIYLGYFSCEKIAAAKYDEAALKYFGSFARTNQQMGLLP